jgi:protocatechuate 3,4-dioxygenase beta subunit
MILSLFLHVALADIVLDAPATQHEIVHMTVLDALSNPVAAATVRVRTHPGLTRSKEWTLGLTDSDGRVQFTPVVGGPHRIRVGGQRHDFSVAWSGPYWPGMISLGLFLTAIVTAGGVQRWRHT